MRTALPMCATSVRMSNRGLFTGGASLRGTAFIDEFVPIASRVFFLPVLPHGVVGSSGTNDVQTLQVTTNPTGYTNILNPNQNRQMTFAQGTRGTHWPCYECVTSQCRNRSA